MRKNTVVNHSIIVPFSEFPIYLTLDKHTISTWIKEYLRNHGVSLDSVIIMSIKKAEKSQLIIKFTRIIK